MLAQRCGRGHGVLRRGLGWKGLGKGRQSDIRVQKYYKLNNSSFAVKHRAWILLSSGALQLLVVLILPFNTNSLSNFHHFFASCSVAWANLSRRVQMTDKSLEIISSLSVRFLAFI